MNGKIEIEIKPMSDMRYKTLGDYFYKEDGTLKFEIADTGNLLYNKAILIHEIFEQALTEHRNVLEQEITNFDLLFEKEREGGQHSLDAEPGFDPRSPYTNEHGLSTAAEMMLISSAGINWNKYNNDLNSL